MTYEEIQNRMKELGQIDTFGTKKEIKELPNILREGETIEYLTSGFLNGNTWLIVCTNKRILFLDKGMFFGLKQVETPLEKINSIESGQGLIFGNITIWNGASAMKIDNIQKGTIQPMMDAINKSIGALKENKNNEKLSEIKDPIEQLEKFASLRDKGIITEEEFNAKKAQILGL
ncbi:MAG: PH domain-containing protein [Fusobacteriaceae bacterium]|nr:PH domain-containing protein [Fusobacteriaceae bacterium]